MDFALDRNPSVKFFVATDDDATKKELVKRYGNAIYTRNNVSERNSRNGVVDAVVDLFLLAGCKKGIFGSYWSSFSEVAANIGWVPYDQVKIKDAPYTEVTVRTPQIDL